MTTSELQLLNNLAPIGGRWAHGRGIERASGDQLHPERLHEFL